MKNLTKHFQTIKKELKQASPPWKLAEIKIHENIKKKENYKPYSRNHLEAAVQNGIPLFPVHSPSVTV